MVLPPPPKKKILQRSHFFPLFWGSFSKKKKSQEIPVFPTILGVLPPKKKISRDRSFSHYFGGTSPKTFSRDPTFSHYFGVPWVPFPSPKKKNLQRSQFFPLSWGFFSKKKSPEIVVFPTILGFLPPKKISRDPSFSHYLGGPSPPKKKNSPEIQVFPTILVVLPPPKKKISRDPSFSHYLGGPSPQKKKISRDPTFSHYLGVPSPRKFLQRSQFFPLSWWSFPPKNKKNLKRSQLFSLSWGSFPPPKKKNLQRSQFFPLFWGRFSKNFLQRSHFFPLSWGSTSKKKQKKTKRHQGWGLILLYVVWCLSKILRGHIVPHFLRFPLSPLSSFVYLL